MKKIKKVVLWVFVFLWMGNILGFSSAPAEISKKQSGFIVNFVLKIVRAIELKTNLPLRCPENLEYFVRKTAHVGNYFILSMLLFLAFFETSNNKKSSFIKAFLVSIVFSIGDEVFQTFIPGRGGMVKDVFIDLLGVTLAILFLNRLTKNKNSTR